MAVLGLRICARAFSSCSKAVLFRMLRIPNFKWLAEEVT